MIWQQTCFLVMIFVNIIFDVAIILIMWIITIKIFLKQNYNFKHLARREIVTMYGVESFLCIFTVINIIELSTGRNFLLIREIKRGWFKNICSALQFVFRRISIVKIDSPMDHVRRVNVLQRVNGHSSNFNDHPSYSNTNLSRTKNSTLPRAHLAVFLHFPENGPTFVI